MIELRIIKKIVKHKNVMTPKTKINEARLNANPSRIDTLKEIIRTTPAESPSWPNCQKSLVPWLIVRA